MRSPHTPAPNVNLGDDADPASELGPRLAAASQTVQGLLTNYLFYGQRHAQTTTGPDAREVRERQFVDASEERGRGASSWTATHSAETEQTRTRTPIPGQQLSAPVGREDLISADAARAGSSSATVDPLAADGLSVDGLRGRNLTLVVADDPARLHPPIR